MPPTPGSDDHRVFGMTNVTRAHRTSPRAGLHGGRRKAHNRSAISGPAIRPALHGEVSSRQPSFRQITFSETRSAGKGPGLLAFHILGREKNGKGTTMRY